MDLQRIMDEWLGQAGQGKAKGQGTAKGLGAGAQGSGPGSILARLAE